MTARNQGAQTSGENSIPVEAVAQSFFARLKGKADFVKDSIVSVECTAYNTSIEKHDTVSRTLCT